MHQATHVLDFSSGGAVSPLRPSLTGRPERRRQQTVLVVRRRPRRLLDRVRAPAREGRRRALGPRRDLRGTQGARGACAPCPGARLRPAGDLPPTATRSTGGGVPHASATLDDGAACSRRAASAREAAEGPKRRVRRREPASSAARARRIAARVGAAREVRRRRRLGRARRRSRRGRAGRRAEASSVCPAEGARAKVARLRGVDL